MLIGVWGRRAVLFSPLWSLEQHCQPSLGTGWTISLGLGADPQHLMDGLWLVVRQWPRSCRPMASAKPHSMAPSPAEPEDRQHRGIRKTSTAWCHPPSRGYQARIHISGVTKCVTKFLTLSKSPHCDSVKSLWHTTKLVQGGIVS